MGDDFLKSTLSCMAVLCGLFLYATQTEHGTQALQMLVSPPVVERTDGAAAEAREALEAERDRLAAELDALKDESEQQRKLAAARLDALQMERESAQYRREARQRAIDDEARLRREEDAAARQRHLDEVARREAEEAQHRWVLADQRARQAADDERRQRLSAPTVSEPEPYNGPYYTVPPRRAVAREEETAAKSRNPSRNR